MIEPLNPNDSQDNRNISLLNKVNELVEWANERDNRELQAKAADEFDNPHND